MLKKNTIAIYISILLVIVLGYILYKPAHKTNVYIEPMHVTKYSKGVTPYKIGSHCFYMSDIEVIIINSYQIVTHGAYWYDVVYALPEKMGVEGQVNGIIHEALMFCEIQEHVK
jgi:hypothetical protein